MYDFSFREFLGVMFCTGGRVMIGFTRACNDITVFLRNVCFV